MDMNMSNGGSYIVFDTSIGDNKSIGGIFR